MILPVMFLINAIKGIGGGCVAEVNLRRLGACPQEKIRMARARKCRARVKSEWRVPASVNWFMARVTVTKRRFNLGNHRSRSAITIILKICVALVRKSVNAGEPVSNTRRESGAKTVSDTLPSD